MIPHSCINLNDGLVKQLFKLHESLHPTQNRWCICLAISCMLVKGHLDMTHFDWPILGLEKCRIMQQEKIFGNLSWHIIHYSDVIMSAMSSQITGVPIVCVTVCSGADQMRHQSSASLAFVRGIHRWPVNSPHKGPVTLNIFPFDDVTMPNFQLLLLFARFWWPTSRLFWLCGNSLQHLAQYAKCISLSSTCLWFRF